MTTSDSPKFPSSPARTCLCSPTTHPGSFRCSFHRSASGGPSSRGRVKARLVRVSSSKWNSVKAFLLLVIRPSSHRLRRRRNFQPQPTRFAREGLAVS